MRKLIFIILGLLIIFTLWLAHQKFQSLSVKQTIKIGASLPLSGNLASYGEAFKSGMILAEEELGKKAKNFGIIFEDNAYDSQKAISAFLRLKQINKADMIINWGDATSYAVAPVVKDNPVPFLAAGATNTDLAAYSPYLIRFFDTADHFTDKLWKYFRQNNIKNIAMVKTEIVYFINMYEALNRGKRNDETVTLVDTYFPGQLSDFKTSLLKIKNNRKTFDALGVFLMPGQVGQFYKQARQLELTMPFFAAESSFEGDPEIINNRDLVKDVVYPTWQIDENFRANYLTRFGNQTQIEHAAQGYDVIKMLITAIDFTSPETIMRSLKQIKNFPGAEGPYTYKELNGDRYFESPIYLKKIESK